MANKQLTARAAADVRRADLDHVDEVVTMLRVLGGHAYVAAGCPDLDSPRLALNAFSTGRGKVYPDSLKLTGALATKVRESRTALRELRTRYPLAASMLLDPDDDEGQPLMGRLIALSDRAREQGVATIDPCRLGSSYAPSAVECLYLLCAYWHVALKDLSSDDAHTWTALGIRLGGPVRDLDRIAARAAYEVEHLRPTMVTRTRIAQRRLDTLATACVDVFEDPSGPDHRPNWRNRDVAGKLEVPHSALLGKQRDGTWRCPQYMARRHRHQGRRFRRPSRPK